MLYGETQSGAFIGAVLKLKERQREAEKKNREARLKVKRAVRKTRPAG